MCLAFARDERTLAASGQSALGSPPRMAVGRGSAARSCSCQVTARQMPSGRSSPDGKLLATTTTFVAKKPGCGELPSGQELTAAQGSRFRRHGCGLLPGRKDAGDGWL